MSVAGTEKATFWRVESVSPKMAAKTGVVLEWEVSDKVSVEGLSRSMNGVSGTVSREDVGMCPGPAGGRLVGRRTGEGKGEWLLYPEGLRDPEGLPDPDMLLGPRISPLLRN